MTKEEILKKIQYGDYITLGKMLGTTPDAAKQRLRRDDDEALDAMARIIEGRENIIKEFSTGMSNE